MTMGVAANDNTYPRLIQLAAVRVMDNDTFNARVTTTITLASVIEVVVLALLIGLFDPHVDNDKIFAILGPARSLASSATSSVNGRS